MNLPQSENCTDWQLSKVEVFWNKIAAYETVFHLYDNEERFMDLLAGFVGTGINAHDCNVVIASKKHLEELNRKLLMHGVHVSSLIEDERYYPLDAEEMLQRFMKDDAPDEGPFIDCISGVLQSAKKRNRRVRTYREMTAILKERGNDKATTQLEVLWSKYQSRENLSLFCAYPKMNFNSDECVFFKQIGIENLKVVKDAQSATSVFYKDCLTPSHS